MLNPLRLVPFIANLALATSMSTTPATTTAITSAATVGIGCSNNTVAAILRGQPTGNPLRHAVASH